MGIRRLKSTRLMGEQVRKARAVIILFYVVLMACIVMALRVKHVLNNDEFARAIRQRDTTATIQAVRNGADPTLDVNIEDLSASQRLLSTLKQLFSREPSQSSYKIAPLVMLLTPNKTERRPPIDAKAVQLLINHGARVDAVDGEGDSALLLASDQGNFDVARILLSHGAYAKRRNCYGCFPLIYAKASCIPLLIQYGAGVNDRCQPSNMTPIMAACQRRDFQAVRVLIEQGADVNAQDNLGRTPLVFATSLHDPPTMALLLSKGAKPYVKWGRFHTGLPKGVKRHLRSEPPR